MNGELAQTIALITYGNDFLSAQGKEAREMLPSNSTFQYVSRVSFKRETTSFSLFRRPQGIARCTRSWFSSLKAMGVKRLRLAFAPDGRWVTQQEQVPPGFGQPGGGGVFYSGEQSVVPQHVAVGFAGGGDWVIQADSGKATHLWRAIWSLDETKQTWKRIWSVEYQATAQLPAPIDVPEPDDAANELYAALNAAETLAEEAGLACWADQFAKAVELLQHPDPTIPFHPDVLPPSMEALNRRQLLASAFTAWVFGGMGSWNDDGFPDDPTSYRLYRALVLAIASATNNLSQCSPGLAITSKSNDATSSDDPNARVRDVDYWLKRLDTDRREEAVQAIVGIGSTAIAELISMERAYQRVREILKSALQDVDAEAVLLPLVDHDNAFVRAELLLLLTELIPDAPSVAEALRKGLQDHDVAVRILAVQGLRRCGRHAKDAVAALAAVVAREPSDSVCLEAMRTLVKLGPAGEAAVRQFEKDDDPRIREVYAEAFKRRGGAKSEGRD